MVSSDAEANKYLFLKPKFYDPNILTLAEKTKQPVTEGGLLTLGSLTMSNAFGGPVLVITGGMLFFFFSSLSPFPSFYLIILLFHFLFPLLHSETGW